MLHGVLLLRCEGEMGPQASLLLQSVTAQLEMPVEGRHIHSKARVHVGRKRLRMLLQTR